MPATDPRSVIAARGRSLLAAAIALGLALSPAPASGAGDSDPALGAIRFYQDHLSSLRHARCRFAPSCSEYAAQAIARYGLAEGSARAADRLMRCNASAVGAYPRAANGALDDPVDEASLASGAQVPAWLLPPTGSDLPPMADSLSPGRRERVAEAIAFALQLARRGDAERASTEFQRAGSLAGDPEAQVWAFARAGECELAARRWPEAERAFLTAGMLARSPADRERAAFRAAVARFDAGAFTACERLVAVPALAGPGGDAGGAVGETRVRTLRGLCEIGTGDWTGAASELFGAAACAGDSVVASRIRLLGAFAAQGPGLSRRSPALAAALSAVLPGAGQAYAGRPRDGFRHLVFNAALIATVVSFARHGEGPAAYVAGTLALPFYAGNILGASQAARRHDRLERAALLDRALRESAR
jgi:hypothetical protein